MYDDEELDDLKEELNELKTGPKYIDLRNTDLGFNTYPHDMALDDAVEALDETEKRLNVFLLADETLIDKKFQKRILTKELNDYIGHLHHDKLKKFLQDHRVQISRVKDKLNNM